MSRIYRCDRCGTIIEHLPINGHYRIGYQWQGNSDITFEDLCEKCCKELEQWFNIFKEEKEEENV